MTRATVDDATVRTAEAAATDAQVSAVADGLRRVVLTMERLRHHYGSLAGVGETDVMALGNLDADGPLGAAELGERLGITPSSVTALVDRLEHAQLVSRERDPGDRRRLRIVITALGKKAIRRARRWSLDALEGIEPGRLDAMAAALDDLADALQRATPST